MKIKTCDLVGLALDWAVAKADKQKVRLTGGARFVKVNAAGESCGLYLPSTDHGQGGPILERERVATIPSLHVWVASISRKTNPLADWLQLTGPTPLIAGLRCFVTNELGVEIKVPDELLS